MPVTKRRGRSYMPPKPVCTQCKIAPRNAARHDGRCKSCGKTFDLSQEIAQQGGK